MPLGGRNSAVAPLQGKEESNGTGTEGGRETRQGAGGGSAARNGSVSSVSPRPIRHDTKFSVGAKRGGVRFDLNEVRHALRRKPVEEVDK